MKAFERPPPYRLLNRFFGESLVERLLAHADKRKGDFTPSLVGGVALNRTFRVSQVLRDFEDLRPELEARFIAILDDTVRELKLSPINLAPLELELAAHGEGAFFKEHIDTATDSAAVHSSRALTGVYYFHREPKGFTGGELRLSGIAPAADGERRSVVIPPAPDSLLLFPSWAPHEVHPISCPSGEFMDSRFAINCWYRHRWTD